MNNFHPDTIKGIARYVRRMLGVIKHTKSDYELALALAAAKIVVATLDQYPLPREVVEAGERIAADATQVMDLVQWRR